MTIAEISKLYHISPDTLRYYERVGAIPPVPRSQSGLRDYDEDSVRWVKLAQCLRAAGLPIQALVEYANLYQRGNDTLSARRQLLLQQRDLLLQKIDVLQAALDRLNEKLDRYDNELIPAYLQENADKR